MVNLKQQEELKRDANLDPRTRWRLIQDMITWGETQTTVRRNTIKRCLAEQRAKNQSRS
ncbi:MAG: hypothetical protein WCO77_01570 [bacterium]